VFVNVTMLYVPVLVNGQPIKAFVDSGAQTTIMSPSCAEACGISHLIDERYSGIAKGVGTAKIIGKVHNAKIQVGDAELDCAFTVMEGKDVDLLFGLDMLRRHQACIDLRANKLRFQHTEIDFLPENEIPKSEERRMLDEPTVQGPNGTEIGTRTGTIRPEGTAAAAQQSIKDSKKTGDETTQPITTGNPPSSSAPAPAAPVPAPAPAGASSSPAGQQPTTSRYPEASITQLTHLGFSREEAIGALDATGGNVEYAAGLLFGQM
jgi:DNA damage-inducible protein 1